MKKSDIINALGLVELEYRLPRTATAQWVQDRIDRSQYYNVYTDGTVITIDSQWLVTQQEIAVFKRVTGLRYIKLGSLLDNTGYWPDWCRASRIETP